MVGKNGKDLDGLEGVEDLGSTWRREIVIKIYSVKNLFSVEFEILYITCTMSQCCSTKTTNSSNCTGASQWMVLNTKSYHSELLKNF